MKSLNILGIRIKSTCLDTEFPLSGAKIVPLSLELQWSASLRSPCLHIRGGVTGYESFVWHGQTDFTMMQTTGWNACAGTPGRWDQLFIPANQISPALVTLQAEVDRMRKEHGEDADEGS